MGNRYFIDTGAYFARFYSRDQHHTASLETWSHLESEGATAVTTIHVIDELATLLARRTSYTFSGTKIAEIYDSEHTGIARSSEDDERKALMYFRKYADQKISFTDCLSFVTMKKLSLHQVFTFDRHFKYVGFDIVPDL